jgi:hypothetical protein
MAPRAGLIKTDFMPEQLWVEIVNRAVARPVIRNCGAVLRRTGEGARTYVSRQGCKRWIDEGLIYA